MVSGCIFATADTHWGICGTGLGVAVHVMAYSAPTLTSYVVPCAQQRNRAKLSDARAVLWCSW